MNKQQNANAKVTKTVLLVMAVLVICTGSAVAQSSLRELAREYGTDWLAGQWKTTTDDGTEILLSYRWVCDGHAVVVDFKIREYYFSNFACIRKNILVKVFINVICAF